ncbi:hypothetical protein GCM10023185_21590 [Hymenobacter saemangeumensis]|uniref:Uncharacterized protein n=1 Tax=Hymenobacter saemangeumensis TaxID=1084522 RepID=A0ABP8IEF4_9BACT
MIQRLFHYAYCGGRVVDKNSPLNGAHRIASVFLTSLLMCLYCLCLRAVYAGWGVKVPDMALYGILVGVVAVGWKATKKWQFRQLHVSERVVNTTFSQRKSKACGWLSVVVSLFSILGVMLTSIFTIENYVAWP